jgi:hypothetical protein
MESSSKAHGYHTHGGHTYCSYAHDGHAQLK